MAAEVPYMSPLPWLPDGMSRPQPIAFVSTSACRKLGWVRTGHCNEFVLGFFAEVRLMAANLDGLSSDFWFGSMRLLLLD